MINRVSVMGDKTLLELGLDYQTLNFDSHAQVYVQCQNCHEEFLREFRNINYAHQCSDILKQTKYCYYCNKYKNHSEFIKDNDTYDKLSIHCMDCNEICFSILGKWAKSKNLLLDDVLYLYKKQRGLCFYTNAALIMPGPKIRGASTSAELNDYNDYYIQSSLDFIVLDISRPPARHNMALVTTSSVITKAWAGTNRIEVKIVDKNGKLPYRKRTTDAGYDIFTNQSALVPSRGIVTVTTGIIVSPPENFYCTVNGRSSLWSKGIIPFRGIIDGTYQGPLLVTLLNAGDNEYQITEGDRIAQLILHKVMDIDFAIVDEFSPVREGRLTDGFGSSGR